MARKTPRARSTAAESTTAAAEVTSLHANPLASSSSSSSNHHSPSNSAVAAYLRHCDALGTAPHAAVLVALRFRASVLRPAAGGASGAAFTDIDMLPLAEVLLDSSVAPQLTHLEALDFSNASLTAHSLTALAHALAHNTHIGVLRLSNQKLGVHGARQLEHLFRTNSAIHTLAASNCLLGQRAGASLAAILGGATHALRDVDLSNNALGFDASSECRAALAARAARGLGAVACDLDGNHVLAEIMNGVTHLVALAFCVYGAYHLLTLAQSPAHASDTERERRFWPCLIYVVSLCTLYLSSTLYHSFFTLKLTKRVFQVLDHAAIFLLIAGSYTPFLSILLPDRALWSVYLQSFLWVVCVFGVILTAFYQGTHKKYILLALYLCMGWAALLCLSDLGARLSSAGVRWLLGGGLAYTAGVPFFVRNWHFDHALWHLFVFAGSACHYWCIYAHVVAPGAVPELLT